MRRGREGKICLTKDNLSRDDDVVGGVIETLVAFVIGRESEENTSGGSSCKFVSSLGREIRIAGATEHMQVLKGGGGLHKG
jgi:hypothetical protein